MSSIRAPSGSRADTAQGTPGVCPLCEQGDVSVEWFNRLTGVTHVWYETCPHCRGTGRDPAAVADG